MNTDTRMAVSAHILAVLTFSTPERRFPSEVLARSVNTNPVVVRRLMGVLKKAGLITVRRGKGGPVLALPPEKITLLDVYKAILPADKRCPFQVHRAPSPRCFAGKNIHDALEMPFAKARNALEGSLATTTIADIAAFIRVRVESEQT